MEKVTVVKVGGAIVEDSEKLAQLLKDFAAIPGKKVLVHGGVTTLRRGRPSSRSILRYAPALTSATRRQEDWA